MGLEPATTGVTVHHDASTTIRQTESCKGYSSARQSEKSGEIHFLSSCFGWGAVAKYIFLACVFGVHVAPNKRRNIAGCMVQKICTAGYMVAT